MKLVTLNTHSLCEADYETKLHIFTSFVLSEKPDIIALQEVNQSMDCAPCGSPDKFLNPGVVPLKADNHALKVYGILKNCGLEYYFSWAGIKCGYGKFDEGLATFSLSPIKHAVTVTLSGTDDYKSWKTRKCLITEHNGFAVCNTHMGWWDDNDEPFSGQWKILNRELKNIGGEIFLMGDFNSPSHVKGEGYDLVTSSGWFDTYHLAKTKDEGFTVSGIPDGWSKEIKSRIDYIFTNRESEIISTRTIFTKHPVSDHYGVIIRL